MTGFMPGLLLGSATAAIVYAVGGNSLLTAGVGLLVGGTVWLRTTYRQP